MLNHNFFLWSRHTFSNYNKKIPIKVHLDSAHLKFCEFYTFFNSAPTKSFYVSSRKSPSDPTSLYVRALLSGALLCAVKNAKFVRRSSRFEMQINQPEWRT